MNEQQRKYATDVVVGSVLGCAGASLCWVWFLGDWCRAGLEAAGVL